MQYPSAPAVALRPRATGYLRTRVLGDRHAKRFPVYVPQAPVLEQAPAYPVAPKFNCRVSGIPRDRGIALEFFEKARETFCQQILDQTPANHMGILVGDTGWKASNMDVYTLFEFFRGPHITKPASRFYDLWTAFATWALTEGLVAKWEFRHAARGNKSWYVLTAKPLEEPVQR